MSLTTVARIRNRRAEAEAKLKKYEDIVQFWDKMLELAEKGQKILAED